MTRIPTAVLISGAGTNLQARVQQIEHRLYPVALRKIALRLH